jgi:hypothetical protein
VMQPIRDVVHQSSSHHSLYFHHKMDDSTLDSFEQFYSFQDEEFKKRISVISMKEFIELEAKGSGLVSLDENTYKRVLELSQFCENRKKSEWAMLRGCLMQLLTLICDCSASTHV